MKNCIKELREEFSGVILIALSVIVAATLLILTYVCITGNGTETRTMRVCHIEKDIILLETSDGEVYAFTNEGNSEYKVNDICTVKFDLHKIKDNTDDTIISVVNNGSLEEWGD